MEKSSSRRLALALLLMALVAGLFFRGWIMAHKTIVQHDEGISYLAATGHQNEYMKVWLKKISPYGTFAPASDWKRLIRPEETFVFGDIRQGLADSDNHPPLYFWLLHLWVLVMGVDVHTGPMLSLIFFALGVLILYKTASTTLGDPVEAGWACLLFALSPAAMFVGFEARHYELLSMVVIAFVAVTTRFLDLSKPLSKRWIGALFLVTTAGLLTQYMFMFVALGAGMLGLVRLIRHDWKRLLKMYVPMALAVPAMAALHPQFWRSFFRQQEMAQPFAWSEMPYRFDRAAYALAEFFSPKTMFPHWGMAAFVIVLLGAIGLAVYRPLKEKVDPSQGADPVGLWFVYVYWFLWNLFFTLLLYFTFISQRHTVGPKYLYGVWPFIAVTIVLLCRLAGNRKHLAAALIVAMVAFNGVYTGLTFREEPERAKLTRDLFDSADTIVIDNPARGISLRFLYYIPDNKKVLVASQSDLLKNPDAWLGKLEPNTVWVSCNAYMNSEQKQSELLALLERGHTVKKIGGGFLDAGTYYLVE